MIIPPDSSYEFQTVLALGAWAIAVELDLRYGEAHVREEVVAGYPGLLPRRGEGEPADVPGLGRELPVPVPPRTHEVLHPELVARLETVSDPDPRIWCAQHRVRHEDHVVPLLDTLRQVYRWICKRHHRGPREESLQHGLLPDVGVHRQDPTEAPALGPRDEEGHECLQVFSGHKKYVWVRRRPPSPRSSVGTAPPTARRTGRSSRRGRTCVWSPPCYEHTGRPPG